jgi:hypothetical protein
VFAIIWHAYFAIITFTLALFKRPSRRSAGMLLGLPFLSVSVDAWLSENPFNVVSSGLVGIGLLGISSKLPPERPRLAPLWTMMLGAMMFVFGWVYPHFLDNPSLFPYLYSAPVGLIP